MAKSQKLTYKASTRCFTTHIAMQTPWKVCFAEWRRPCSNP